MKPHWGTVRESVLKLVSAHDKTRFGLMAFPAEGKCSIPAGPAIPLTGYGKSILFDAYFQTYGPGMSTPLLAAVKQVRDSRENLFGDQAGTVVILSDGEDTCEGPKPKIISELKSEITALTAQGVKTYVIGYNYQGDTGQLNVMARSGGTGYETFIPAGNEAELNDAFKGIVSDIKLCL